MIKKLSFKAAPEVFFARPEENEEGGQCFKVTIRSNPAPFLVQWLVKTKNDDVFRVIDPSTPDNKGTSDSFTNPVLVIKDLAQLECSCFQIKVYNVIGSTIKVIPGKLIYILKINKMMKESI